MDAAFCSFLAPSFVSKLYATHSHIASSLPLVLAGVVPPGANTL